MRKISLTNLLFEDIEDDIADDIEVAFNTGPAAVRNLVNKTSNKKVLKKVLQGDHDKVVPDDKVSVGNPGEVRVGDLIPTQNEIDLMKSVAFPLGGFEALKKMVTSKTSGAPGYITISGNEVLDGHHRWSGVWGISGPDGTIQAQDLGFSGDTDEKLAAAQLAIAAYKDSGAEQPSASGKIPYNILGKSKKYIRDMILDNVGEKTDDKAPGLLLNDEMLKKSSQDQAIADWAGFEVGDDIETVKDKIADRVAENLGGKNPIPENRKAPNRADMPQFDHDSIGGKKAKEDIYAGLKAGDFNVKPPFKAKDVSESAIFVTERWQRLAGILKG